MRCASFSFEERMRRGKRRNPRTEQFEGFGVVREGVLWFRTSARRSAVFVQDMCKTVNEPSRHVEAPCDHHVRHDRGPVPG